MVRLSLSRPIGSSRISSDGFQPARRQDELSGAVLQRFPNNTRGKISHTYKVKCLSVRSHDALLRSSSPFGTAY